MDKKHSTEGSCKTPLSELKADDLKHYEELSTKGHSWNNQIPQAIEAFYNEKIRQDSPFQKELEGLINKYSQENASNTPDFILAEYLDNCLDNYNKTVAKRDEWNSSYNCNPPETEKINVLKLESFNSQNIKKAFLTGTIYDGRHTLNLTIINIEGKKRTFNCEPINKEKS